MKRNDLSGMKVTVMGLGLNGGGIETVRFLAASGAELTVTDLRDEKILEPAISSLAGIQFRGVFGRHEMADFASADMVLKNPAVRPNNPFIAAAARVETDLSLFLGSVENPIIAVTGSKGKSTTASCIHHGLLSTHPGARLGGNITISPLSFIDELEPLDPVVLELSSFQLGDLARSGTFSGRGFSPFIATITNIYHDHQDYYGGMDAYVADKEEIFLHQDPTRHAIFGVDDDYGEGFAGKARATVWRVSARERDIGRRGARISSAESGVVGRIEAELLDPDLPQGHETLVPHDVRLIGLHHRMNLACAGVALHIMGVPIPTIRNRLSTFPGVEHRLEFVRTWRGLTFINDSAATIPEAVLAAVSSIKAPVHLICGGTDKALDFGLFPQIRKLVKSMSLLRGSASDKIAPLIDSSGQTCAGPFDGFSPCFSALLPLAEEGDVVLLSPGCASFGLFLHEFDRGRQFKDTVNSLG